MKKKRFLSLIVSLSMLFTSFCVFTAAAEAEQTVTNVGQGVTYKLPAAVGDIDVTEWKDSAGGTVTEADTSLVGYRYYTAVLSDGTTSKYRVNVGEYKELMKDNFESYTKEQYDSELTQAINGGTFTKGAYADSSESAQRITEDNGNKVGSFGPKTSSFSKFRWTTNDTARGGAFKVKYKLKVAAFNLAQAGETTYFLANNISGANAIMIRSSVKKENGVPSVEKTEIYCHGTPYKIVAIDGIEWVKTTEENVVSMKDYITVEIEGNNVQYSTSVNGTELDNSRIYNADTIPNNGVNAIELAKRASGDVKTITYIDDLVYSKAIYPADTLTNVQATDTLAQGDNAAQTTTVTLSMSDNTKKDFTVNYTADTSQIGSKTAQGTIEGFDDKITVNYTVLPVSNNVINTFVGADAQYPDKTAVDTTALGRRYRQVSGGSGITKYTVNVGDWDIKRSDDMSWHTNTTVDHDNNASTPALDIVDPIITDGFPMSTYTTAASTAAAVIDEIDGNKVLKFTGENNYDHIRWNLKDSFDGSFKYSMRLNIVVDTIKTASRQCALRFTILNTKGQNYLHARILTPSEADDGNLYMQLFRSNAQANDEKTTVGFTQRSDGKYETGWFNVDVIGKADTGLRDVYVNGKITHRDFMKYDANVVPESEEDKLKAAITDCTFNQISMSKEESEAVSAVYVDDVSVSSYYKYEGDLPSGQKVFVGKGKTAEGEIALTFSNGAVKHIPAVMPQLDTSKLGSTETEAVLEGFDDTAVVSAKVCNYDVSALSYKYGEEFTSAPLPGGTIHSAQVRNMGDDKKTAIALFAWYDADNSLKSVKKADISNINIGETKTIEIGLDIPKTSQEENLAAANGYMKVFVLDNISAVCPLDLAEIFSDFSYTAPRLFVAGDSTNQTYDAYRYPQTGIAQEYEHYFDGIEVKNYAQSGKSTATFIQDKLWDKIESEIVSGDYVIISFGHNDQSTLTAAEYEANIRKFVAETRAKGANPVLHTPIARRMEGIDGTAYKALNGDNAAAYYNKPELAGKMDALKRVAQELNVPFIDMIDISSKYLKQINNTDGNVTFSGNTTDKATAKLYVCDFYYNWDNIYSPLRNWTDLTATGGKDYDWNNADYRKIDGNMNDNTHPTIYGANVWAQMIAKEIKGKNLILSKYATNLDKEIAYPTGEFAAE